MKKIILVIIALLVLAIGGMFLYVSMVDWNSHKDKIAGQFSNVTGKDVVFEGPVSFKVFPSPYLSADNVKIYDKNRQANPNALASIKNMQVDLSLFSLFSGQFDVKRMVISEPEMIVEILPEGKINWQSPVNYDEVAGSIDVKLDSVTIQNATLHITSKFDDCNVTLDNLNAEVVGESIFGPYRIEGTYIKDNNPEGFAVSLGRFSDSFATSLNFVINHPRSNTYLRFDGSFFLKNSAINGSVVFESAKIVEFLNSYFGYNIGEQFEYPVAVSMEVNTNRTKLDISNFVVKYGDTVGAGNVLVPLKTKEFDYSDDVDEERKKIEISFNMTDLDLTPFVEMVKLAKEFYDNDKTKFSLDAGYDILFDMKSIKTTYRGQNIRDFNISTDILEDTIVVNSMGAILPGETSFTSKGRFFALEDLLTYNFDIAINSVDALRAAQWLGYEVKTLNQFSYRNMELTTKVSGNMKNIKISPLNLIIDKSTIEGDIGIVRGKRPNVLVDLTIDSINFDNYIEQVPEDTVNAGLNAQFKYWFSKLKFLNDVDMQYNTNLNLGIYATTPFENTDLSFKLENGNMDINNFSISSVKNASVDFKGEVSGFGVSPKFANLKYNISSQNFYSIFPENKLPKLLREAKDFKKIDIKGVITGDLDKFATKTVVKLDNLEFAYSGNIDNVDVANMYDGKIELRAPDFIKFVNRFNVKYNPRVISMGVLRVKSSVKGADNNFQFTDLETYIGSNKFEGDLSYKNLSGKPEINTKLHISRFELDRFFYNVNKGNETAGIFAPQVDGNADFIAKPYLDKTKIDYSPYASARINGEFVVDSVTYKNEQISQVSFNLAVSDSTISVTDFKGEYLGSNVSGKFDLGLVGNNTISGTIKLDNKAIEKLFLGKKYGLDGGMLNLYAEYNSVASSPSDFFTNLNGNINFMVADPTMNGWNLEAIEQDLLKRKNGEGLLNFVTENLQSGKTEFNDFRGDIALSNGNYNFVGTNLSSNKFVVQMKASGNIDMWDIKSEFDLDLRNVNDLPNINFGFNGPISSPALTANVDGILDVYQQRQNAIEEDKKQKEAERIDRLTFLMGEEQDKAVVTEKVLLKNINFINSRIPLVENPAISAEYKSLLSGFEKLKNDIDFVISTSDVDETTYTQESVAEVKKLNENADREILIMQPRVDSVYLQDVKDLVNRKYNDLAAKFRQSRINIVNYRDTFVQYPRRMAVIEKVSVLNNDKKVQDLKDKIEDNFLKLDAINSEASKDYVNIQSINDVLELEGYIKKADEMVLSYERDEEELEKSISELISYLEEFVSLEEQKYDIYVEEELKKQKIEENKGSISTSSGKSMTVVRDIEDIEKSEEMKQNEEIRVLDFSTDKKASGTISTGKKVITREEMNSMISNSQSGTILKKVDGEVSGATGSISKK